MLIAAVAAIAVLVWIGKAPRRDSGAGLARIAVAAHGEPAAPASAPSPFVAGSAAAISHGPDELQICGGAWIKTAPDGSIDPAELERAARLPQARAALLAKLAAGPGELARLAGVFMAAIISEDQRRAVLISQPTPCEGAECAAVQIAEAEVAQARERIARAAVASDDPKVYALALNLCSRRREGTCQMLSAQQWARLDPDNATPWLQILDEATARKDAAAQSEALHRVASAKRNEVGWLALTGEVLKAMPSTDDNATLPSLALASAVVGFEAAWSIPGYSSVSQLCRGDALGDANRAQLCAGVATVLAERSDTFVGRNIGGSIGTRLGWPAERYEQMRGEYNAYINSYSTAGDEAGTGLGCARMRRELDRLRSMTTLGEVGALRQWVVHSGRKPEDFIREERARQQHAQQGRAEAAASAAASAAR